MLVLINTICFFIIQIYDGRVTMYSLDCVILNDFIRSGFRWDYYTLVTSKLSVKSNKAIDRIDNQSIRFFI